MSAAALLLMPGTVADVDDAATFRALRDAVDADRRGWSGRAGRALLDAARQKLAPLAASVGADPADAAAAAWELWSSTDLADVESPWAYTVAAVRRRLGREEHAARLLTSEHGLRRHGSDVKPSVVSSDREAAELPEPVVADESLRSRGALSVRQVLVMAGVPASEATAVIAALLDSATRSSAASAAVDRLSRDRGMADRFGFSHTSWRALVTLTLGTTRGQPGLIELTHRGHPAPLQVEYIRRAKNRFSTALELAA